MEKESREIERERKLKKEDKEVQRFCVHLRRIFVFHCCWKFVIVAVENFHSYSPAYSWFFFSTYFRLGCICSLLFPVAPCSLLRILRNYLDHAFFSLLFLANDFLSLSLPNLRNSSSFSHPLRPSLLSAAPTTHEPYQFLVHLSRQQRR